LRLLLAGLCAIGCASAPVRDPSGCGAPAERAEIQQVQVGWKRPEASRSQAVDPSQPSRDERQAEELASELFAQCRKGARMDALQDRYSEAPGGSILVGPQARVPFRGAALCLPKTECALVRSDAAYHVLKRID